MGALHYIVPITKQPNLQLDEVRQLFTEDKWNEELISNTFNEEICDHIKGLGQPHKILPIGEVLINSRIANSVECWCCNQSVQESIEHLFMKCPDSESQWKDFAWETADVVPKLKPLYKVVPMFIVWQIWRRRNVIAHGDKMSRSSMKMAINRDLYFMKNPLSLGAFKCNTDGACKDNFGPSSGAYCVRAAAGRFIYAETKRLGYCTNLIAEIKAFRLGLEYCTSQNLVPLTMETYSLSVKKILDGLWEIPWNVAMDVREIWRLMERVLVVVEHVYREGNKLAYFLNNEIFSFADADNITYANIQELPRDARQVNFLNSDMNMTVEEEQKIKRKGSKDCNTWMLIMIIGSYTRRQRH
ncbi:hypothetical protein R3W88_031843 [Solanum pinnatisectum]|uniref:RNase H type-1 domain-containing protein n=1 Tax=Solanum pinnatisectum TaxID=50273 RepID=A0AAV9LMI4_9SOLN|nr:hypothetical protein R3W88_031843 [Solanum pinnatisectum]